MLSSYHSAVDQISVFDRAGNFGPLKIQINFSKISDDKVRKQSGEQAEQSASSYRRP